MYDRAVKTTNNRVSTSNVFIGHHPPSKLEGIQQSETHIHLIFNYTFLLYCTVNKYSMFSWLERSNFMVPAKSLLLMISDYFLRVFSFHAVF